MKAKKKGSYLTQEITIRAFGVLNGFINISIGNQRLLFSVLKNGLVLKEITRNTVFGHDDDG